MSETAAGGPAVKKGWGRGRLLGAALVVAAIGAVVLWRFVLRDEARPIPADLENHSVKLKQAMMLEEQRRPAPAPEPEGPAPEPTRAARSAK